MNPVDLRSDTVTRPTEGMRRAMATAEVGDDVYGEDPTVNRLEATAAEVMGKEAALFVPSGTMANQAAVRAWTRPGDVVLAGWGAHVLRYEAGAAAGLNGVQIDTLAGDGRFDADRVRAAVPPDELHHAPASLLCIENTHNVGGGTVWPQDVLREAADAARQAGLRVHLDGARVFNAAVASGVAACEIAAPCDSVSFCLSKGLGAPVGSLVCGEREFVKAAHRFRKMMGGGMRQAGILAAAGLYALEHHVERLADDHANALRLAEGLLKLGLQVDAMPETNIVMFRVPDVATFLRRTRERGLLVNPIDDERFRAVTHLDVAESDVERALDAVGQALAA